MEIYSLYLFLLLQFCSFFLSCLLMVWFCLGFIRKMKQSMNTKNCVTVTLHFSRCFPTCLKNHHRNKNGMKIRIKRQPTVSDSKSFAANTLLENLTYDAIAQLNSFYVTTFSTISLSLTKLYITQSFAITSSVKYREIRQNCSNSKRKIHKYIEEKNLVLLSKVRQRLWLGQLG